MADSTQTSIGAGSQFAGSVSTDRQDSQDIGQVANKAVEDAKELGNELLAVMRDSANTMLDQQRSRAADQIAAVGDVVRRSAESLDKQAGLGVSDYAETAAQQIENFARAVRERSWSEIAGDIEDFARSWPMAYLATAVALGFVGGRLLFAAAKSGSSTSQPTGTRQGDLAGVTTMPSTTVPPTRTATLAGEPY